MCYSGRCEFEDSHGDCMITSKFDKIQEEHKGFIICGCNSDPEEHEIRKAYIDSHENLVESILKNL